MVVFWPFSGACRILGLPPRTEPMLSTVKTWNPNHWTTREFPDFKYSDTNKLKVNQLKIIIIRWPVTYSY